MTNLMMHLYVSYTEVLITLFCEDYGGLGLKYIYICVYAEKFYGKNLNCLLGGVGEGEKVCLQVWLVVPLWQLEPLNLWQSSGGDGKEVGSEFGKVTLESGRLLGSLTEDAGLH